MRGLLLLLLVGRVAVAEPMLIFIQVAPSRDGGAWLLVHDPRSDIQVRRVAPDGTLSDVAVPTDRAIRAIAASPFDDSLWVVTDGPLLQRTSAGTWRRVLLPVEAKWGVWYGRTNAIVTPIAPDRAVVFRGCGEACTDVSIVDAAVSQHDEQRFGVLLGPAVGDGRGGLWAIVRERRIDQGYEVQTLPGGYAHLHDGRWDAWTEAAIDHMDMHPAQIVPTALAADGRGGAIAVVDDELATIDPAGNVSGRGSIHC